MSNKTKRVWRSGEDAKPCMIYKYGGAIKVKYKKHFPYLLTIQTSADAIVRYSNIKEDEDMLKIVCDGKLLEREFMVHDKCYTEYAC